MTCKACAAAASELSHLFISGCMGCCARAAARSPQYRKARDTGIQDRAYRSLLEQFGLTHEQVRDAAAADVVSREGGK